MRNFLKYLPNIVIILLGVGLFLAMSNLMFDLNFEYLLTAEYWVTSFVLATIYTASHWSSYDAKVKALTMNREEKARRGEFEAKIKQVTNSLDWLDYKGLFITRRNREEKIEAYRVYIQNKLTKLLKRASPRARDLDLLIVTDEEKKNLSPEQLEHREKEIQEKKMKCRYIRRKTELEKKLDNSWLQVNIDKIHISYNKISEQFVSTGGAVREIRKDYNNPKWKYLKENIPSRLVNLFVTTAVTAFAIDLMLGGLTLRAWFDFGVRCGIMIVNVIMGVNYGRNYYEEIFIDNLVNRLAITDEFLTFLKDIKTVGVTTNGSKNHTATV